MPPLKQYNISVVKQKIIFIRNAYSEDFGGGERMPVNTARILDNYHDYETLVVSRNNRLLSLASSYSLATTRGWWWKAQDWSGPRALFTPVYCIWLIVLTIYYVRLFSINRPTIVHIQSKDDFIAGSLAARVKKIKVVWSDHADLKYIYQNNSVWYKNPVGKIVKWCDRFASHIVLTSQNDKMLIESSLGKILPPKYKVIYNGVIDQPKLLKIRPNKTITFTSTSRLVSSKGIGEMIEAFINVQKKYKNTELWILGEGPEEDSFKKMAGGNNSIRFLGFPDNALSLVAKCQIFIHPSYMEGFSVSLIEACMLGKPIIACDVGGNPEIISSSSGILVSPRSSLELTKAMRSLLDDPISRDQMSLSSRKNFETNYNLRSIIAKKYIPIYEN